MNRGKVNSNPFHQRSEWLSAAVFHAACLIQNLPPPRRTWYNYCLMPLSWVGEVADIPLSLIATPVGWLVDAVYEPIAN